MALPTGQSKRKDNQAVFDADGRAVLAPVVPPAANVAGVAVAPAAAAVIADTGPLPAGDYQIEYEVGIAGVLAAGKGVRLEHRNAANSAAIRSGPFVPAGATESYTWSRVTLAANERIRAVVGAVAGAASEEFGCAIRAYQVG
jgi:hypothetical protein